MITAKLKHRGADKWGSGEFGASRGDRTHSGIDYACEPGMLICAPVSGVITKLGYPYADDLSFRYVQITNDHGQDYRVFYVEPRVEEGWEIRHGDVIGECQDLRDRYPGMVNHVHLEIKHDGKFCNPEPF